MDVIRFTPGQLMMHDRKNPQGEDVLIELSPLWQDGEYHFIVKNVASPWRAYYYVNKQGLDMDGVLRVAPIEYNSWAWMEAPGMTPAWFRCRRVPNGSGVNLVQFEAAIPGVYLHNGGGAVPEGRAWWVNPSRVVDGTMPPAPKRPAATPPAATPPVPTSELFGWGDSTEDGESDGEHTLPPMPVFVPAIVASEPQQHRTSPLPTDWRERVWQAYMTTGGEMTKLIQDYKQLYQAE